MESSPPPSAPRPAATIVVARPASSGRPTDEVEIYLVKRHHKSGFMAGAHVFPGGRVEDQDHAFAQALSATRLQATSSLVDGESDDVAAAAFAIAAIRETAEECGIVLARSAQTDDVATKAQADAIVRDLRRENPPPFQSLLAANALELDLEGLLPLAWWLTPTAEPKRYDTRFFATWAPAGQIAAPDLIETTEGEWLSPVDALTAYADGRIALAPPTLVTLEDLQGVSSVDAIRRAVARPIACVCPRICALESGLVLALPGDPLHASPGEDPVPPIVGWTRTRVVQTATGRFASARA